MEAIMASIESALAPLSMPPSSSEAPTLTAKQNAYVDNRDQLGLAAQAKPGQTLTVFAW
jgi:hypothetical protein